MFRPILKTGVPFANFKALGNLVKDFERLSVTNLARTSTPSFKDLLGSL